MYFDQHCLSLLQNALSFSVVSPLRCKPLHLQALLRPLKKMSKHRACQQQLKEILMHIVSVSPYYKILHAAYSLLFVCNIEQFYLNMDYF